MKYECFGCEKPVDENEIIVVTDHVGMTGTYFFFYCETCYNKTKEGEKLVPVEKVCTTCIHYAKPMKCNRTMTKLVDLDGCPGWSDKVEKD